MKQKILILCGFIALLFGAVGILLPVLPTTPFVLLAAGCFSGSPRLHTWLCKNSFFREYITNYKNRQGLSKKTVIKSLVFLWGMLLLSIFLTDALLLHLLLILVGIGVTIHILMISRAKKTSTSDNQK